VARVDITILREIVRVIESLTKVPEFVTVSKRRFQLTYLEDHRQRIEEALRRHDRNQLNMLFGQLASKVKYQALRMAPDSLRAAAVPAPAPTTPKKSRPVAAKKAQVAAPSAKSASKKKK